MTKDEALNSIKETLKKFMTFKTEEVELKQGTDVELQDGTKLTVDGELTVGSPIYKLDDMGAKTPCEDGTYELKDGRSITVAKGAIESVSDANPDAKEKEGESPVSDATPVGATAETMADAENPVEDKTEGGVEEPGEGGDINARVSAIESQIAQILEILQGMANMNEQTMAKVNKFAASPAEDSIKSSKKVADDVYSKSKATNNKFKSEIDELKELMKKNPQTNYGSFGVSN